MIEEDKFLSDQFHVFPEGIFIPRQSFSIAYQQEFIEEWLYRDILLKDNRYINKKKRKFLIYLYNFLDGIRNCSEYKQDKIVKEETE